MNVKIEKNTDIRYFVIFYIITIITMISVSKGINIVSQAAFILLGVLFLVASKEIDMILLFCLIPFPRLFMINYNFYTLIPILEVIIVIKSLLSSQYTKNTKKLIIISITILIYSTFVEYIRYSTFTTSIEYFLKLLVMIYICLSVDDKFMNEGYRVICISTILSAIGGILSPELSRYTALYYSAYNKRIQGMLTDPGTFGQVLVCAISCIIVLTYDKKYVSRTLSKLLCAIYTISCLYFILLSGTRACLIGITVIYVIVIFWMIKTHSKGIQIFGVFIVIVSLLLANTVTSSLFNIISSSHGGESIMSDTRYTIWMDYWNIYKNDLSIIVFGVGMDSCNRYGAMVGIGNPHNIIIEKIMECGLIGLILNISFFYEIIKSKLMRISEKSTLPFYSYLSTLLVYGAVGTEIPYYLLALIKNRSEDIHTTTNQYHIKKR